MTSVKVTRWHIEHGTKGSERTCPIALALMSQGYGEVRVNKEIIEFSTINRVFTFHTPNSVKQWITRFDCALSVEPMEFELL